MEGPLYLDRLDKTLKLWSVSSGECLKTFHGHSNWVIRNVAFSPDGRTCCIWLVRQDFETMVCFWWRVSQDFPWPQQLCTQCGFQSRWKDVVSGSDDKTLKLWSVSWWRVSQDFPGPQRLCIQCGFQSRWKNRCIWLLDDKTLKLWSVSGGECLKTFQGHSSYVYGVAFSPDGRTVVSGSSDKTLKLWSVSGGECLKTFQGHSLSYCTQCGIQSRWKDRCIWLVGQELWNMWSVSSGECLKTFQGHNRLGNGLVWLSVQMEGPLYLARGTYFKTVGTSTINKKWFYYYLFYNLCFKILYKYFTSMKLSHWK